MTAYSRTSLTFTSRTQNQLLTQKHFITHKTERDDIKFRAANQKFQGFKYQHAEKTRCHALAETSTDTIPQLGTKTTY